MNHCLRSRCNVISNKFIRTKSINLVSFAPFIDFCMDFNVNYDACSVPPKLSRSHSSAFTLMSDGDEKSWFHWLANDIFSILKRPTTHWQWISVLFETKSNLKQASDDDANGRDVSVNQLEKHEHERMYFVRNIWWESSELWNRNHLIDTNTRYRCLSSLGNVLIARSGSSIPMRVSQSIAHFKRERERDSRTSTCKWPQTNIKWQVKGHQLILRGACRNWNA